MIIIFQICEVLSVRPNVFLTFSANGQRSLQQFHDNTCALGTRIFRKIVQRLMKLLVGLTFWLSDGDRAAESLGKGANWPRVSNSKGPHNTQ